MAAKIVKLYKCCSPKKALCKLCKTLQMLQSSAKNVKLYKVYNRDKSPPSQNSIIYDIITPKESEKKKMRKTFPPPIGTPKNPISSHRGEGASFMYGLFFANV